MIRINLLPGVKRRDAAAPSGDGVRALGVLAVLMGAALIVALYFFHTGKQREYEKVKTDNASLSSETAQIKQNIGDHAKVIADIDAIHAKQASISELQAARTGPTSMFIELSHVLSVGGHPSVDPDRVEGIAHGQTFNSDWNTHLVWLSKLTEDEREVTIEGAGRFPDDVGEFMQRLKLSRYFEAVALDEIRDHVDEDTKVTVQRFKVTARVRY